MGSNHNLHWVRQGDGFASPIEDSSGDDGHSIVPLPAAWQCDLATEELRWTSGVFDLFGIPRGSPVDRRGTLELYTPESRETLVRLRSAAINGCGSFTFEAQIRRSNGELRWMRLCADVQMKDGRAVTLYGTKQDITAEMALSVPAAYLAKS